MARKHIPKGQKPVIIPELCKIFTNHLTDISDKNLSWTKLEKSMKEPGRSPDLLRHILVGIILFPGMAQQKKYICKQLLLTYREEVEAVLPFTYSQGMLLKKIPVKKIDKFCKTLINWFRKEVISECTFSYFIEAVCTIFQIPYAATYLTAELLEMMKEKEQGEKLTSFSKFRKRKKKPDSRQNKQIKH